jgi:hypothetical protein
MPARSGLQRFSGWPAVAEKIFTSDWFRLLPIGSDFGAGFWKQSEVIGTGAGSAEEVIGSGGADLRPEHKS